VTGSTKDLTHHELVLKSEIPRVRKPSLYRINGGANVLFIAIPTEWKHMDINPAVENK
jgi:kynurenine formamidase